MMDTTGSSMEFLISKGVGWWGSQLYQNSTVSQSMIVFFQRKMIDLLVAKFKDHWFPEKPLKGQAYRSILVDKLGQIDPVIIQSARFSGITTDLLGCFSGFDSIVMWIDPNEVVVKTYSSYCQGTEEVLYQCTPAAVKSKRVAQTSAAPSLANPFPSLHPHVAYQAANYSSLPPSSPSHITPSKYSPQQSFYLPSSKYSPPHSPHYNSFNHQYSPVHQNWLGKSTPSWDPKSNPSPPSSSSSSSASSSSSSNSAFSSSSYKYFRSTAEQEPSQQFSSYYFQPKHVDDERRIIESVNTIVPGQYNQQQYFYDEYDWDSGLPLEAQA